MKTSSHKTIFSFLGPPGSGKGTLATRVVKELGFAFLSTGNLCRKHVSSGTDLGKRLDEYLKQGTLIPDDLITKMVATWLRSVAEKGQSIILDGYPRTEGQAVGLLSFMQNELKEYNFRVFLITLDDEEIVKRLTARRVCSDKECQEIYSRDFEGDVCKLCGKTLMKRSDDAEEVIRARLQSYPIYRDALLGFYEQLSVVIEQLNVTDTTKEQVFCTFRSML